MTADNDKAEAAEARGPSAGPTVVGVPALAAADPGDLERTRQLPPAAPALSEDEQPTAIDARALSPADAERVLSSKPPAVSGALPRAAPAPSLKTPLGGNLFPGLSPGRTGDREPERATRSGVAPQPGTVSRGRSTLLLDGSAPPGLATTLEPTAETPPIVVPASGAQAPQAVTRPPPWGEGAARVGPTIPRGGPTPRPAAPVVEEITGSHVMADASQQLPASNVEELTGSHLLPADSQQLPAARVEELSGSVLVEDAPGGDGVIARPVPPGPSASARPPSVRPPVPRSASARPPPSHAQKTLLGMLPVLPKSTPPPKLDEHGVPAIPPAPRVPATTVLGFPPAAGGALGPVAEAQLPSVMLDLPPSNPAPVTGDVEVTHLPVPRGAVDQLKDALAQAQELLGPARGWLDRQQSRLSAAFPDNPLLHRSTRPAWFLPAVGVAGIVVGVGMVGLLVTLLRGPATGGDAASTRAAQSASAAPGSSLAAVPSPLAPAPSSSSSTGLVLGPCTVSAPAKIVSPTATLSAGVEVALVGSELALGFAPGEHDALVVQVEPQSLGAGTPVRARSRDAIRRVTPVAGAHGLSLVVDVDRKGDRLQGRRTVRPSAPLQLGATGDGHLAWARVGGGVSGALWALGGTDAVEALRGAVDSGGDAALGVAFRRAGSIWMGTLGSSSSGLTTRGALWHVDGLGPGVGAPAIATSGGVMLVAWADRASAEEPWRLRWTRFAAGEAPSGGQSFAAPAGGKGEPLMSPGLAAVPGGRFLLVWTEGPSAGRAVRALTLGPDGAPVGPPLTLSADGVNAGQGQAAFTESGAGVVAYLQSGAGGFQVAAAAVACGEH